MPQVGLRLTNCGGRDLHSVFLEIRNVDGSIMCSMFCGRGWELDRVFMEMRNVYVV